MAAELLSSSWDVLAVGVASLAVGVAVGARFFLPRIKDRREIITAAHPLPPKLPPGPKPGDRLERQGDKMHRMNAEFARRLAVHDPGWNPNALHARVAECFMGLHTAWAAREPEQAQALMTTAMYERRRRQADHQLAFGKRDVIKDLRLHDVDLVYVSDREGKKDDVFWAIVSGSKVTYEEVVDFEAYKAASGATTPAEVKALQHAVARDYRATSEPTKVRELWKFLREGDAWLLDEISFDLREVDDMPRPFSDDVYPHDD